MSKIFVYIALLIITCSNLLYAQWRPTGNLTVFTDDGTKFFLVLNGQRYNDDAQSNIRIEELPNPYYSCRIIFENNIYPEISKKRLLIADVNGMLQDVTFQIRKNKKDNYVLNFYSYIPAVQNMLPPPDCAVYRFGAPNVMIQPPMQNAPTQQDVMFDNLIHQPVPPQNFQDQINVNVGGVGINVTIPNNNNQMLIHDDINYPNNAYTEPIYIDNGCIHPMNTRDFAAACNTIKQNGFDETRLNIAKQIAATNCLSSNQIIEMMQHFSFEQTKLTFAKIAFEACTDPGNYFKVGNAFSFEVSKIELNNYISGFR